MTAPPSGRSASPGERRGGRRKARDLVLRALYESDQTGDPVVEILELSLGKFRLSLSGRAYAVRLAESCAATRAEADAGISALLESWDLARVAAQLSASRTA